MTKAERYLLILVAQLLEKHFSDDMLPREGTALRAAIKEVDKPVPLEPKAEVRKILGTSDE